MSDFGNTLFLDQSHSSTGFALYKPVDGGTMISGEWPLGIGVKHRAEGFRELFGKLDAMNKGHGLDRIVHEEPVLGAVNKGADQIIATIGLVAVIELFAISRDIPTTSIGVGTWRTTWFMRDERRALKGKDWKHPAVVRARQLGFDPVDHNEAEAIALCDHYMHTLKLVPPWRKGSIMLDPVA